MQISIVAVGRLRPGPESELIGTYLGRLAWPVRIIEVEERRPLKGPERRSAEASLIAKAIPPGSHMVALDERGVETGSPGFAQILSRWQDSGKSHITFVIGGAGGLDQSLREQAATLLSFGRMTWPHMLVRVMLAEQLYRAATILQSHPYHK